ncbi:MAG: 5'-nucleotidase C-terminal domain-containing protein [Candidatus Izimaplasma sp.]|nr:5'-nucleotidase C-terminal domain-containing protein [Candidatus Izimaplasma bacterium]
MKKILSVISLLLVGIVFVSCGNSILTTDSNTTTENETTIITTTEEETTITTSEEDTIFTTTEVETTTTEEATTIEETTTEITTTSEVTERYVNIDLYSMNDFHGGAYSGIDALSYIGDFIKDNQQNSLYLTNGDIFQGTAISNYYYGLPLVDSLNEAGFDGFIIGNHEFDWGIDKILDYRDGSLENGELNHEILAANIVYQDTQMPLENTTPYIIEEFDGVRVGVIGLIGELMNSIAVSRTQNIEFKDPILTAAAYASELRNEENVDIVVVYIHDGSAINEELAQLVGSERIDAVFNGHYHRNEASSIERTGIYLPYGQVNNYDSWLVRISLEFDREINEVIGFSHKTFYEDDFFAMDSTIDSILDAYESDTTYLNFINEELTFSNNYYDKYDLVGWGASVIRDYANVDVGATNSGGFRVDMPYGSVTMGDMITIYPFDNVIKTSRLTGQQLLDFYVEIKNYGDDVYFDDGLEPIKNQNNEIISLTINGVEITLDGYYTVGAVDYIFDKEYYDFIDGEDITLTTYLMRDLLVEDLRNSNGSFNPDNGTNIN